MFLLLHTIYINYWCLSCTLMWIGHEWVVNRRRQPLVQLSFFFLHQRPTSTARNPFLRRSALVAHTFHTERKDIGLLWEFPRTKGRQGIKRHFIFASLKYILKNYPLVNNAKKVIEVYKDNSFWWKYVDLIIHTHFNIKSTIFFFSNWWLNLTVWQFNKLN